eukprot:m.108440 g.108440  ORF g.108440 m.108440 type:complete len:277 (+) comp16949_c0_seq1:2134-2964(+)
MHWAARNGHADAIKTLIEYDGNVSAENNHKYSPMHWAAYMGHPECILALAEGGADIEARDTGFATPLHWAVSGNREDAVKELIDAGADVDVVDVTGQTPLHWAVSEAEHGLPQMIALLLHAGADDTLRQHDGMIDPVTLAQQEKKSEAVHAFQCCIESEEVITAKATKDGRRAQAAKQQEGRRRIAQENAENRRVARREQRQSLRETKRSLQEEKMNQLHAERLKQQEDALQNQEMARQEIASDEKARILQFEREQKEFIAYQKAKENNAARARNM